MFRKSFARDSRGVALVEFAMVAPILLFFYVAMAELCQGLLADRKSAHTASAIGDLIAQVTVVDSDDVNGVFDIAEIIMAPFPTGNTLQLRVSSVRVDDKGVGRVRWSDARHWTERAEGEAVPIPTVGTGATGGKILNTGESAIMAEVIYRYDSPFSDTFDRLGKLISNGSMNTDVYRFNNTYWLKPRRSSEVTYES